MFPQGSRVIVAVSGGIAAYKAADLVSRLVKGGAEVRVAMTDAARHFVGPLTFEALSRHPVYSEVLRQPESYAMEHIEWARWAGAMIFAPATADLIARMAHGLAHDGPTTLYLAYRGPVWIAPAMNTAMWEHPATQANLEILRARGVRIIPPGSGPLACGENGAGRMAEPEGIVKAVAEAISTEKAAASQPLKGRRVLITAGPTRESLDPIRFVSNRSTGKMGVAVAAEAAALGASVTLVHGPLSAPIPEGVEAVSGESAVEMLKAVQARAAEQDVMIFAAAVANYHQPDRSAGKIKGGATLELKLVRTPDIAAWAGEHRRPGQTLAGFCAESENLIETAKRKLESKRLDMIFANPIGVPGLAFGADNNRLTLLDTAGAEIDSGVLEKREAARWIWMRIMERMGEGG